MSAEWLGHRDLCPSQWSQTCDCPCPSCDYPLDLCAPDHCKQPEHTTQPLSETGKP